MRFGASAAPPTVPPVAAEQASTDLRVAVLLASAALIAAGVGVRAATLSDSGSDTWQTAIREEVRRDARLVSDVRRLYAEDAAVAYDIAELWIRAQEARREARASQGSVASVLRSEAAARAALAAALARTSSTLLDSPAEAPELDGAALLRRLAELRRAAGPAARLDPDATFAAGTDEAAKGSWLTATVVVVSLAFLCGALAAGMSAPPTPRRRLVAAGYGFAGLGLAAAIAVEVAL